MIQWQYIDETEWNDYDEITGVVNPRTSFVVRVIDDDGDSDLGDSDLNIVSSRIVNVCGDAYSAFIKYEIIDDGSVKKYKPIIEGIPNYEIDTIAWSVYEDDVEYTGLSFTEFRETDADVVCVGATINFVCTCEPMIIRQVCYNFNGSADTECSDLGLEMELEDGCWKPVRTGDIKCCVQLDLILWKIKEDDAWSVLREPIETICGNTVWFKRVVTFTNGCPNVSIEINSDAS